MGTVALTQVRAPLDVLVAAVRVRLAALRTKLVPPVKRVRTPTILQMEAVECGAACLAMVLAYFGRWVPLEAMRTTCGVSRDGTKASNIINAARQFGLKTKGFSKDTKDLPNLPLPQIVFWNFNHFVVVEGFGPDKVWLNDPATGPRVVSIEEFDQAFTGVVLIFQPGPTFVKAGEAPNALKALARRARGSESAIAYVITIGLLLVIPGLVLPALTRAFVDKFLVHGFQDWLPPILIGMGLTAGARAVLSWIQGYYLFRLWRKFTLTTSSKFFWHVLRLPVEFYAQRFGGEIANRVALNDQVAKLASGDLAQTVLATITASFFLLVMFQYSVALTLIGLGIAALNVLALRYVSRKRADGNARLLQERGKLQGTAISGLQSIETIKASGSESDFFGRWAGFQAKTISAEQRLGLMTQLLLATPRFLQAINTVAILGIGGLTVMRGQMTPGELVAFQSLMGSFSAPILRLVTLGSTIQTVQGSLNRLDDVLRYDTDPILDTYAPEPDDLAQVSKLAGALELKDVTFGYSRLEPPLIEDFSISLKPGDRVALVGGSGSGKSTVGKLVCGLYEPWSGEILFDGKSRREVPRSVVTSSLASVDQEIFLFQGTIKENLTLWDTTVPEADIVRAAQDASIYDEIDLRPAGLDGKVDEGGSNFSGGQRQRLEIARALVSNPRILVLDEATSALDPVTEMQIDAALRRRGCTCLIVAHRLSTIRDCDEIIVLEQGKVVQRGTHEQMRHVNGPYARLIAAE